MRVTNFYQPKQNNWNNSRRAWFKYVGDGIHGLTCGEIYSYRCLKSATGLELEALRTRLRDENIDKVQRSSWVVTDFTLRPSQRSAFAKAESPKPDKPANNRDAQRAARINRCEGSEILSQRWLKIAIV